MGEIWWLFLLICVYRYFLFWKHVERSDPMLVQRMLNHSRVCFFMVAKTKVNSQLFTFKFPFSPSKWNLMKNCQVYFAFFYLCLSSSHNLFLFFVMLELMLHMTNTHTHTHTPVCTWQLHINHADGRLLVICRETGSYDSWSSAGVWCGNWNRDLELCSAQQVDMTSVHCLLHSNDRIRRSEVCWFKS